MSASDGHDRSQDRSQPGAQIIELRPSRDGKAPVLFAAEAEPESTGETGRGPVATGLAIPGDQAPDVIEGLVVPRRVEPRTLKVLGSETVATIRTVATHDRTRTAARHLLYVAAGATIVGKRAWESRTTAQHTKMLRAAAAGGDHANALEWEARASAFRRERHQRRMDLLELPFRLVTALWRLAVGGTAALIVLGILLAVADHDAHQIDVPFLAVARIVQAVAWIVAITWGPIIAAIPLIAVVALWRVGRAHSTPPTWVMPPDQRAHDTDGAPITPSIVVVALRDLGLAALRKAITDMGDMGAAMLSPIRIAGCGVEFDVTLPSGTSTLEVQDRRRKLAENLGRHEHEVFIEVAPKARTIRLWVADSGALDEPIGPSPLVYDHDLGADYYTGKAPWGRDLRGDLAEVRVYQCHILITGKSNQGKTASLRALALWLALDTIPEFWIGDLKGVGDWRMFDGIATVLIQGPTDEHVMAVTHMLERGVTEMERRLVALEESGAPDGVTRDMARKPGGGFHPLILIVDEAQVAFMCPAKGDDSRPYGGTKATSRYFLAARKLHNQGRAVNVLLWEGTQDPTDANLPKLVREGAHLRAALYLGTEAQAKMALGEAPVDAGAAPHKLRDGLDRGTVVLAGPGAPLKPGQPAITIRTHFVSGEDGAAIAERAKARRKPITTNAGDVAVEERDLLDDLAAVMVTARARLTDLASLLRQYAPKWPPYASLNGVQLGEQLTALGMKVVTTGNRPSVDRTELQRVLYARQTSDGEG